MEEESRTVWGRRLGDEFWSSVVSPLAYSLLAEIMAEHMIRRPLRAAGLGPLASRPIFRRLAGRVYVNMSLAEELFCLMPRPLRARGLLQLLPPGARERVEVERPRYRRLLSAVLALTWRDPRWLPWRHARLFEESAAKVEAEFRQRLAEGYLLAAPAGDLYRQLLEVRGPLGSYLEMVAWVVGWGYLVFQVTRELIERWAGPSAGTIWPDLVAGLSGIRSLGAAREIAALGRLGGELWPLVDQAATAQMLARVGANPSLAAALERIIERHGHRMSGRDLALPTWREAPQIVLGLARKSCSGARPLDDPLLRRKAAEGKLAAAVSNPARRRLLTLLLSWCRRYFAMREEMRYVADYFLSRLRQIALALGARLVTSGRLSQADDIFYLDMDELASAVEADASGCERARERREDGRRWREESPPEFIVDGKALGTGQPCQGAALLGESASPGRIQGRACVLRNTGDIESMQPGDIVVATYTDPSWAAALSAAGGLALESAGQLSHGAILARELGIPALVNVAGAVSRLRTGDMVVLDASAGTLTPARDERLGAGR